jgi:hypothetical protein
MANISFGDLSRMLWGSNPIPDWAGSAAVMPADFNSFEPVIGFRLEDVDVIGNVRICRRIDAGENVNPIVAVGNFIPPFDFVSVEAARAFIAVYGSL